MRRAFFMRGSAALARDLALLLGRHRRKPSPFLAFSCTHRSPSVSFTSCAPGPYTVPFVAVAVGDPARAGDAARRAASPAPRPDPCRADPVCSDPAGTRRPDSRYSSANPSHPDDYQTPCPVAAGSQCRKSLILLLVRRVDTYCRYETLQWFATEGLATSSE
jgi:hypothetical protein